MLVCETNTYQKIYHGMKMDAGNLKKFKHHHYKCTFTVSIYKKK